MVKSKLHPGARWLFRVQSLRLIFILAIFFFILTVRNKFFLMLLPFWTLWLFIILLGMGLIEIYVRMAYDRFLYELTPSNLQIERGVIWKRYTNIPYGRVQNIDIQRGIFARMLGFSSVFIQTAGASMPYKNMAQMIAEGYIPAVSLEEAEKIKKFIMGRIEKKLGQGI